MLEKEALQALSLDNELGVYEHDGYWRCMDTYRDYLDLNEVWEKEKAWKVW